MVPERGLRFSLLVHGTLIPCSQVVIDSCSLFSDLVMFTSEGDKPSPIPVPSFITRQIVMDLVEVVEKGDEECAHLVLVSISYLLDFLIAVDFLGCQAVKSVVEEMVRSKISDSNWREIMDYTLPIPGLLNTSRHTVQFVCSRLAEGPQRKGDNQLVLMNGKPGEGWDPFSQDYLTFSGDMFKTMLRSEVLLGTFKLYLLRKWVENHRGKLDEIFEMVSLLPFREFRENELKEIVTEVVGWDLTEEQVKEVRELVDESKKVEEEERAVALRQDLKNNPVLYLRHMDMFYVNGEPEGMLQFQETMMHF